MAAELWTTSQAARHCGVTPGTWRHNVSTGVPGHLRAPAAVGRQPGSAGESLFPADRVRAWYAGRPGRGARTDLARHAASRHPGRNPPGRHHYGDPGGSPREGERIECSDSSLTGQADEVKER